MKLKVAAYLVGLLGATAGALLLVSDFRDGKARRARLETISTINKAEVGMLEVERLYKKPMLDLIKSREASNAIGLNRSLALLLQEVDFCIATTQGRYTPLQLLDGYGNPLICLTQEEAVKHRLPKELIGSNRVIIIYSVGANGKDEHGSGDDVYDAFGGDR